MNTRVKLINDSRLAIGHATRTLAVGHATRTIYSPAGIPRRRNLR
ncbi:MULTISPECIES: hypothetical protein [unclassified Moorena]|nr:MULTISPECIES: hypothetical protein [unclassified Moorena]